MSSIAKPILITLGALAAAYAVLVLLVNIYLQSSDVQARLREALSRVAGMPSEVNRTYYTPWSGLTVSGITLPSQTDSKTPLLEVQSLKASIRLTSFLQGRIQIRSISIASPILVMRQNANGSWSPAYKTTKAHTPESLPSSALSAPGTSEQKPLVVGTPTPSVQGPILERSNEPSIDTPQITIESLRIRNGRAVFTDSKNKHVLELKGIQVDSPSITDGAISGTFRIQQAIIVGSLKPRKFTGTFEWSNGHLAIPEIQAELAEGRLGGNFTLSPIPTPDFALNLFLQDVSVKKLAEDAGYESEGSRGQLSGKLLLTGAPANKATYKGTAEVRLVEARVEPIDLIRQLGELLRVDELQMLELKTAEADFSIRDEKVIVDRLIMASENLMMDATGQSGFDGKLDLAARFHVNEKLRRETRGIIGSNFKESETPGYTHIPFSVNGTLAQPKSDLFDKIMGVRIGQDVGGLLKNILRMPKNKKQPTPTPTPSPAQ